MKRKQTSPNVDEEALFQDFLKEKGLSLKEYLESNACTKDIVMFHFRTWLFERTQAPDE